MRLFAQRWESDGASPLSLQTHPLHLLLCGLHVVRFVLARASALYLVPGSLVFAVFAKPERRAWEMKMLLDTSTSCHMHILALRNISSCCKQMNPESCVTYLHEVYSMSLVQMSRHVLLNLKSHLRRHKETQEG